MSPGDQPGSGGCTAHLPSPRHVCPLQGRHEPGTGLPGERRLIITANHSTGKSNANKTIFSLDSAQKCKQGIQKDFHNTADHQLEAVTSLKLDRRTLCFVP